MVSKGFSTSFEFRHQIRSLESRRLPELVSVRHPVDFPKHTEATRASHYDA